MPSTERNYGRIAAATGLAAILLTAFWYRQSWNDGFAFPPLPTNDPSDLPALYAFWLLAIAFEFGVPLLCLVSGLFGFPARREKMSRIGLVCAVLALVFYAIYVRSCSAALFGSP
jgi:uncharacterized membrane protein YwaF